MTERAAQAHEVVSGAYQELDARGLIAQSSDAGQLAEFLDSGVRTLYCGFDPTAKSLHIGNLVPLLTLRRLQDRGHRPIVLLGGATGLIGDPSGRSEERNLNDADTVAEWVANIRRQTERIVSFEGANAAIVVNNLDWTRNLDVISFLRDTGKHFSVSAMIQRDSVRSRLDREGEGISFTEFSYMLLQALDFAELAERYDCRLQIGGSDQWGNIVSGMDLVRRKLELTAHVFTVPLVTKSDGTKFGKTASGAVWLDPEATSPYGFYQFWLNSADDDVERYLKIFTLLELDAVEALIERHQADPGQRLAQRELAREVTVLVHGEEACNSAERITRSLFDGSIDALSESDLEQLSLDGIDGFKADDNEIGLLDALSRSGLAASNGAARQLVKSGAVYVNGAPVADERLRLGWNDALFGRFYLLRRGKKAWRLLARN